MVTNLPPGFDSFLAFFDQVEPQVKRFISTAQFYFGDEEKARIADGHRVVWMVNGAQPGIPVDLKAPTAGKIDPRPFDAEKIELVARCYGEGRVNPSDADARKAQYAASEHLAACVRYAVKRVATGKSECKGWTCVAPQLEERGYVHEVRWDIWWQLMVPPLQLTTPPETETIASMTIEH